MRQAGWYSLKEKNELILITYSLQNRIKAILGFMLLGFLFVYYHITNPEKGFDIANFVVILIIFFFLIMSLLSDKYLFYPNKAEFTKIYGILPFIVKKNVCFSSIESIEIENVEKKPFLEYLGKSPNSSYFTILSIIKW
jgi:hypothetical protein